MGSFCDYLEAAVLDHIFGLASYTAPNPIYVGLSSTLPTDAGGNITEPGSNYARVSKASGSTHWQRSGSTVDNKTAVTFATAAASWGTVGWFFLSDAASGTTNILGWGALSASKTIDASDTAEFAVGDLDVSLD
jgi:hypothetical protein